MATKSQIANIYIGVEPPEKPNALTRWISQSARHYQVPHQPFARIPIIGSGAGISATQEMSPWYNTTLQRYECTFNTGSAQYFAYADTPLGPWSSPVKVLGNAVGGEASNAQQCTVYVEGTTLYAVYLTGASATNVQMATAQMPTTVSGVPVFTKNGTIFAGDGSIINDSPYLINVGGLYYMFTAMNTGAPRICTSAATSPAGFIATPFTAVTNALEGAHLNIGVRYVKRPGRPQVFYENGTWILYGHIVDTQDFAGSRVYRWTCDDVGLPLNWVADVNGDRPFLEQAHPLEVDQIADFRVLQGPNGCNWAFWTAADNPGVAFTIMCAPVQEPMMAFDGYGWYATQNQINDAYGQRYIDPDAATTDQVVKNMWDIFFRTEAVAKLATFPVASSGMRIKLTNAPLNANTANPVKLAAANATDKIMGGNPITAMTAVAAVVTVTTQRPHNLSVGEFVTVTGAAPTAYNINAVAIGTVPALNQFTYTAASAPAANTTLGCYDVGLLSGESRRWRCRVAGIWVRD